MNRDVFFTQLIKELNNIEKKELEDVLQYYNEYFDEAGVDNEQDVIKELGSPKSIAMSIKSDIATKNLEIEGSSSKKSFKALWISIGAIFAAPIALPLALALVIVCLAVVIVILSLLFALYTVSFASLISGLSLSVCSFAIIPTSVSSFILTFGAGLILIALSIFIFVPTLMLTKSSFKQMAIFINKNFSRRKNKNV